MSDIVEQALRVLSEHVDIGDKCSCGFLDVGNMEHHQAQALADAGLLRDGPLFPINDDPEVWEKYRQAYKDVYETAAERIGTGEAWTIDAREALGMQRTVPTRAQIARALLLVTQAENVDPGYAWDVQFPEVQDELLAQADAVLALLTDQPTIAETKAQTLEEIADSDDFPQWLDSRENKTAAAVAWLQNSAEQIREQE